ncbi:MAG TPA: prepilin-type N-terminal cleavage/methylation domain-containing protein [Candidatus Paceibacterota bacterium]|nr:prepilin-type N-terminal cleavage/methylation domain-containing protein [Candidatus Paceibacterota bacterium]
MTKKGFTLIETLIYIALLGLLLTGAITTSYLLMQSAALVDSKNAANEEAEFVMQKLTWVLSGAQAISVPSSYGSTLSVARYDGISVDMRMGVSAIEMSENASPFNPLTTSNVQVTSLSFHYLAAGNGAPAGVEASTTVNGIVYYAIHYLPK